MDFLIHIATMVVVWVIVSLLVRKILKDGWKSLFFNPFKKIIPARSVRNDKTMWDHLDED